MTKEFYGTYCKDKNELPFVTLSGSVFLSGYHRAQWLILLLGCKNILQFIISLVKKSVLFIFTTRLIKIKIDKQNANLSVYLKKKS